MSEYASIDVSRRLLYQVTLASGRVVTSPEAFGDGEAPVREDYYRPVFAEDGRLLSPEAPLRGEAASQEPTPAAPRSA